MDRWPAAGPLVMALTSTAIVLSLTSCATGTSQVVPSHVVSPTATPTRTRTHHSPAGALPAKLKDADPNNRVTLQEVTGIAEDADKTFVDGWIDGRDSRTFKSYYRQLPPVEKAQFAMAYHDMVENSNQNLAESYKTYIPYSERVKFARHYWENSNQAAKFKSEIEKMQVAWLHESLLDGSELWWRAAENHFGSAIDSPTQMAHDVEQNMVSKYMEDEGTESTFSQQMSDKSPGAKQSVSKQN